MLTSIDVRAAAHLLERHDRGFGVVPVLDQTREPLATR
jgi:hypothetical protein